MLERFSERSGEPIDGMTRVRSVNNHGAHGDHGVERRSARFGGPACAAGRGPRPKSVRTRQRQNHAALTWAHRVRSLPALRAVRRIVSVFSVHSAVKMLFWSVLKRTEYK